MEGDGTLKSCNISQARTENWYDFTNDETSERLREVLEHPVCRRKLCSCYLAYGGRSDVMNQMIFGAYPLFRIPRKAKAVFLDIDGTLIPEKNREKDGEAGRVSQSARTDLELLNHTGTRLFFATSLSYRMRPGGAEKSGICLKEEFLEAEAMWCGRRAENRK